MDPIIYEGAEGRRRKKTKDPSYTGPIKYIGRNYGDPSTPGFKGGYVIDTEGKKHLAGKVQSIPDTTRPTEPDTEDEETRREATMRRDLRESGVIKATEDYQKSRGPSRIRDIADNARLDGVERLGAVTKLFDECDIGAKGYLQPWEFSRLTARLATLAHC